MLAEANLKKGKQMKKKNDKIIKPLITPELSLSKKVKLIERLFKRIDLLNNEIEETKKQINILKLDIVAYFKEEKK